MSTARTFGRSPELGPHGASGGVIPSARFYENPATSGHDRQTIGPDDSLVLRWTAAAFDELGFPPDWGHYPETGYFLFPRSGYWLIEAYVQIEPNEGEVYDSGTFWVSLDYSEPDGDDWWEQVGGHALDPATRLDLCGLHRIDLDATPGSGFTVSLFSNNVSGYGYVSRATISLTWTAPL